VNSSRSGTSLAEEFYLTTTLAKERESQDRGKLADREKKVVKKEGEKEEAKKKRKK